MENKELLNLVLRIAEKYYSLEYDIYDYEDNIVGITITTLVQDDFSKSFMILKASELIEESKKFNARPYQEIELQDFEDLYVEYEYSDEPGEFYESDGLEEEPDEAEDFGEYGEYYSLDQNEIYDEDGDTETEEEDDEDEVTIFLEFKTTEEMQDFVTKSFF